jgi:hypothetical protein
MLGAGFQRLKREDIDDFVLSEQFKDFIERRKKANTT